MVAVGRASYSIYLWQQLFLDRSSASWAVAFPMNLFLVAAVATISYHLIEKPSIATRVKAERWLEREFGTGNRRADAQPEGRREVPAMQAAAVVNPISVA